MTAASPRVPAEETSMHPAHWLSAAALLSAVTLAADGDSPRRVDERLLPSGLTDSQKTTLANYLAAVKRPERFIPESARVISDGSVALDPNPVPGAEIKEYLTSIVPYRPQGKEKPPEKVEVYWYRP